MRVASSTVCLFLFLTYGAVRPAAAQDDDRNTTVVSVHGALLASFQPIDDAYVSENAPYLDEGLGGLGPGIAAGLSISGLGAVGVVELSTAALRVSQSGRLVGGDATGRLRDTLVTALGGFEMSDGLYRVRVLAGISRIGGMPTLNGTPIDRLPGGTPLPLEGGRRLGFSAGLDVVHPWKERLDLMATARYTRAARSQRHRELGVGPHIFRAGVGVALRAAATRR